MDSNDENNKVDNNLENVFKPHNNVPTDNEVEMISSKQSSQMAHSDTHFDSGGSLLMNDECVAIKLLSIHRI